MSQDRRGDVLEAGLAARLPANILLMRLLAEADTIGDAETAISGAVGRSPAGDDGRLSRLRALRQLLATHPDALATIRSVLREADHDGRPDGAADAVAHWSGVFERLAERAPEAGVALYALGSPELLAAATAEVVASMRSWGLLGQSRDCLDVGCGIGRLSIALAPAMRSVTGLDVSAAMIAEARRRAESLPNLTFRTSSGRDLSDVPPGSADVVLAADVFPYLVMAGRDVARRHVLDTSKILRSGGALLILNYSYRGCPDLDLHEIRTSFSDANLALERVGSGDFGLWDATTYLGRKS